MRDVRLGIFVVVVQYSTDKSVDFFFAKTEGLVCAIKLNCQTELLICTKHIVGTIWKKCLTKARYCTFLRGTKCPRGHFITEQSIKGTLLARDF